MSFHPYEPKHYSPELISPTQDPSRFKVNMHTFETPFATPPPREVSVKEYKAPDLDILTQKPFLDRNLIPPPAFAPRMYGAPEKSIRRTLQIIGEFGF